MEGEGGEVTGGEEDRGKCVRSWRPLQGSVVAMAIDSTSTLLATGLQGMYDSDMYMHTLDLVSRFQQWN